MSGYETSLGYEDRTKDAKEKGCEEEEKQEERSERGGIRRIESDCRMTQEKEECRKETGAALA